MTMNLTIGAAAQAAGLTVEAVRFYERSGVLAPPPRTAGRRRVYEPYNVLELTFIARLRAVRMPLPEIARYLALARQGDQTLAERAEIVAVQRTRVIEQIAALQETLRILDFKLSRAAEIQGQDGSALRRRHLQLLSGGKHG